MSTSEEHKDQWEEGIRLRGVRKAIHARSLYYNKLDQWHKKINELPAGSSPDSLILFNELSGHANIS